MTLRLGVVMDPIATVNVHKDSTLAMLLAAQARGWEIYYMEQADLFWRTGVAWSRMQRLQVFDDALHWFALRAVQQQPLQTLDVILMRKDPPFNLEYIYTTYLLEQAEAAGVLIVNKPQSLRDANEKLFTAWFPHCCPDTLVTSQMELLRQFLNELGDIICKPLDGMGGASIFRLRPDDPNIAVILETMTAFGTRTIMAQRYLPAISQGDKRILLIDGQPIPYALARIPALGETRGNLAAGGQGVGVALNERDRWLCAQVAPTLQAKGLLFVGLDVIGDYLTEINVTSPTCIRQLDEQFGLNIGAQLMTCISNRCAAG